jgi:hypothetical protein
MVWRLRDAWSLGLKSFSLVCSLLKPLKASELFKVLFHRQNEKLVHHYVGSWHYGAFSKGILIFTRFFVDCVFPFSLTNVFYKFNQL